jgi:hypothetical protein
MAASRKRFILIAVLIVVVLAIVPVTASDPGIKSDATNFSKSSMNGSLALWEQDLSPFLEDGDTVHFLNGAQFLPNCLSSDGKTIQVFAVISTEGGGTVPELVQAVVENDAGSYTNHVPLSAIPDNEGIIVTRRAEKANLISYPLSVTPDQVISRLREGNASAWKGAMVIPFGHPAGEYRVTVAGADLSNPSLLLTNSFQYMPVACMVFDFSVVNYGDSKIGRENLVQGDTILGTSEKPSVQNTGNIPARIKLVQDDMGFGKNTDGAWNVQYGIQIGNKTAVTIYEPDREITLSEPLQPGAIESLDFSTRVIAGQGNHTGSMNISFEMAAGITPVANFSAHPTNGVAPLNVTFTDASTNAPATWLWSFGDGTVKNATVQNPVHTYTAPGLYNVTLTANNTAGSNTTTKTRYINVSAAGITPPGVP